MRLFFLMLLFVYTTHCKKESVVGLEDLFDDPDLLFELKKRLGNILDSDYPVESAEDDDCLAPSGLIESDCKFHSNKTTIIKTKESLARGATFLADFSNITCARDCTAKCCENPECDTVVYQNKEDHNCYLFKCEESSLCVFAEHSNYLMSSISKAAHASHSFTPGGATYSHENELQNLGSHDTKTDTVLPTTTQLVPKPAKQKPGLADFCESYESECADPHAECLMKECTCRVGYHEKHKTCRKHCREDEFECEQYRPGERQCVHKDYVCDRTNDCMDGSDEYGCPGKDKTGDRPSQTRPYNDKDTKVGVKTKPQGDKPVVTEPSTKTLPPTEPSKVIVPETVKPTTVKPTEAPDVPKTDETVDESQTPTDTDQTDTDTDKSVDTEPVNSESTADQSTDDKDSKISNISSTDSSGKAKDAGSYNFLNTDNVEVESFTDSSQGPVVALALGLAITMMLLIFVGCRLRTVKRRLRKGRTLHSNEADYLINGMYL